MTEDGGWIAFDTRDQAFVGAFRMGLGKVAMLGLALLVGSAAGWFTSGARAPWVPPVAASAVPACATCGLTVCGGCVPATPGAWARLTLGEPGQVLVYSDGAWVGTESVGSSGVVELLRGSDGQ